MISSLQMPKELKQRIEDYFQTSWSLSHGIDIYEVSGVSYRVAHFPKRYIHLFSIESVCVINYEGYTLGETNQYIFNNFIH